MIDNGIAGDGRWQVDVLAGGETVVGNLDPVGSPGGIVGLTSIIFDYFHYVDVGADGGGVRLGETTVTSAPALTGPNQVTSAGSFAGANGTIEWTAVSSIASGSTLYLTTLTFSSTAPFGTLRVIQYLDEDVVGVSDDHLIVIGTAGAADFQLLTIDDDLPIGVAHAAGYLTAVSMTYIGWSADQFADLRSAITGSGATYSIAGVVDTGDLTPISDARFPGAPAFGPEDITSAIAFDVDPDATFASVLFSLGGSPTGAPPPPPVTIPTERVPAPGTLVLLGLGVASFTAWRGMRTARR